MMPTSLIRADALNELVREARAAPPGDFVEIGVYQGGSAAALAQVAREQERRLWLFDTFSGIPYADECDRHKVGDFADTSLDAVRSVIGDNNITIVSGVFPRSAVGLDPIRVALAHIDCDQYRCVKESAKALHGWMIPGGVMVFDDYDCLPGARKAVDEVFGDRVKISEQGKARVYF